jgi:serine/threonine-protein kinase
VTIYDSAMTLEVGQVFAGYTIVRVLGVGGMGAVYLASHPRLPRQDALKVLPADLTVDPEFRARFMREAELAGGLSHPNIVGIYDRGEEDGQFWISMDYVAGTDLGRLLRENYPGGMLLDEAVPIIAAVGSALDYAHQRGLLHRDVKPANILLADPDGQERRVFLADFGIARRIDDSTGLTATNMTVGTATYAAPEQLRGDPLDGRADQYALACTAFHMLTGAPPYQDSNPVTVISQHVNAPPPSIGARRPELAGLDPVFAAAMAKTPSGRFGSCQEFAQRLGHPGQDFGYAGAVPFPATPPPFGATPPTVDLTVKRRRSRLLIGALVGVALLIAGGVFAVVKLNQPDHSRATGAPNAPNANTNTSTAPAPNTGPLTGTYTARFDQGAKLSGAPVPEAKPLTDTYAFRSVCGSAGCVATAARLSGDMDLAKSAVFDQVGGRWVSVTIAPGKCNGQTGEAWEVFTLEPRPDGTLGGEYRGADVHGCAGKRPVTFTRTGDVDVNSLPDPAKLPARVASPAEALHGHYHWTRVFKNGLPKLQDGPGVVTDCLRTGDRCVSYFQSGSFDMPMTFAGGNWTMNLDHDQAGCGGTVHIQVRAQYPLPQPPQDPITTLTGNGHTEQTGVGIGTCATKTDFVDTFTRTGN